MTRLADVAAASARVAATPSRLAKVRELAALLRALDPAEVEIAIPMLSGDTRQGRLSTGYASLRDAKGGAAASSLVLRDVDAAFQKLKDLKGKGSAGMRATLLRELFGRAVPEEADFLVRLLLGELRQGALEGVLVEAVAEAAGVPAAELRRAASFAGSLAPAARAALAGEGLAAFSIRVLQPVQPMLAQPAEDVAAALAAHGEALLEWKLDGARVQVHKSGADVRVYTRNLNDVTGRAPEVVAAARAARADAAILDGEAIALRADGRPHPFQVTMRRFGRKLDVEATRAALPLSVFFFDCLLRDGVPLVDRGALERRAALQEICDEAVLTPHLVTADAAEGEGFFRAALAAGHEGIMAKHPGSRYEAGRRGAAWLKVKSAKTLDLVVLAAEWGSGRRQGFLSNLHLGARDPAGGGFVMLGKTFKGLTDDLLAWQTRELLARETGREGAVVRVRPELVVEIAFNDLQESPHYPAGLALRFARVKGYRPDKDARDADTIETVRRFHEDASR